MPNGIAVTRMTLNSSQFSPPKTNPKTGVGAEKPKVANELFKAARFMPPKLNPKRFDPQAMSVPAAMATKPAGMPPYFTPPNQLTMMIAKQTTPMTGVMNIERAGAMEM